MPDERQSLTAWWLSRSQVEIATTVPPSEMYRVAAWRATLPKRWIDAVDFSPGSPISLQGLAQHRNGAETSGLRPPGEPPTRAAFR